jgi:hypothetical protein
LSNFVMDLELPQDDLEAVILLEQGVV